MKNTFLLPAQNTSTHNVRMELTLPSMGHIDPNSIIADSNDTVFFADIAANRIVKVEPLTFTGVQFN